MFDDPTPEEVLHSRFRHAALQGRVDEVRQILAENPGIANETQRMPNTVLQALCLGIYSFQYKPEHVECMVAIVENGGDMAMAHNHIDSPIAILLRRGAMPALRALADKGLLADAIAPEKRTNTKSWQLGVGGTEPLKFVCQLKQWRDADRNYPLADLVRILIDAGARPCKEGANGEEGPQAISTNNSAIAQLVWSLEGSIGVAPPSSSLEALKVLIEHDKKTMIDEDLVMRAWRSKVAGVFDVVAKRYFEQGGTHQDLQENAGKRKMKPQMAAKLQSDALAVMTAPAPQSSGRTGIRF